ncbi:hypothetical protein VL15_21885 [Burkholderia cepacia]|uniref:Uncharacterized protein n=1 Tax=Burkholderia cepacia TaxID=292 RepID=A0A0J5ZKM1_BURCE|nr:hypothetical protein [Burkholderia cepacia]KML53865.1 hypothetical protein VL15_21885 [Burkholderia cepacia]
MDAEELIEMLHSAPLLEGADRSFQHFLKFLPAGHQTPNLRFSPRGVFVDIAHAPQELDFSKLIADCEILKDIVGQSGPQIQHALNLFKQSASSKEEFALEAYRVCEEIGLTEKSFAAKGGGFLFIVLIAIFAAGCATCNGGKWPPVKHP